MPRRSKLTPELQARICKYIEEGYTIEQSCALSGIGVSTYYRWLEKGRKHKKGKYQEFWEATQTSEQIAEAKILQTILQTAKSDPLKNIKGDWKAAAWYLERRKPKRWAKTEKLQQDIKADVKKTELQVDIEQARKYFEELEKE